MAKQSRQHDATMKKLLPALHKAKLTGVVQVTLHPFPVTVKTKKATRVIQSWQATVDVDGTAMRTAGRLDGF